MSTAPNARHAHGREGVVEAWTPEQARVRCAQILEEFGCDEAELRRRADRYLLGGDQLAAFDQFDDLSWLLRTVEG